MTDMISRAEANARVAAVIEAAAKAVKKDAESGDISDGAAQWVIDTIRALTPDDARAALDQMLSDAVNEATKMTVPIAALDKMMEEAEKRGEKRGMLRAAEIADTWTGLAAKAQGGTLTGGAIALAIRAEAEE